VNEKTFAKIFLKKNLNAHRSFTPAASFQLKNVIPPEQVMHDHRYPWRGGMGGQALSPPHLTCPVISSSDKRIYQSQKRKIPAYSKN
jgi:hypothetical protein